MNTTGQGAFHSSDRNDTGAGERAPYRVEERAIGLFVLGVVLFNPLMLDVFDRGAGVVLLGVPLLFLYVFGAWALLIALLACIVGARSPVEERPEEKVQGAEPPSETP
jgi:hypothetical protein